MFWGFFFNNLKFVKNNWTTTLTENNDCYFVIFCAAAVHIDLQSRPSFNLCLLHVSFIFSYSFIANIYMFLFLIQGFSLVANLVVFPQNVRCCCCFYYFLRFLFSYECLLYLPVYLYCNILLISFVILQVQLLFAIKPNNSFVVQIVQNYFGRLKEANKKKKNKQQANKITEYWFGWLIASTHGRDNHQHSNSNLRPISSHTSRQSYRQP